MAGLGSGATDFLSKPFSPRLLLARIEEMLKAVEARHLAAAKP